MTSLSPLVRAARPRQWIKNLLVFAAPGAAGVLDDPASLGRASLMFVAFCFAATGTYFWNDVLDVEADRAHPTKSLRPIAAGQVSMMTARLVGTALPLVGLAVSALTGRWESVAVLASYLAVTLTYSAIWKHIAVLDLVAIASGFVLRAVGGAVAVDVEMSTWFVLVTSFGSLFVVTGKRYAEARELGAGAGTVRSTLDDYTEGFLRYVMAVTSGGALVSYCIWAFETKERAGSDLPYYELSIVPIVIAFLRYALTLEQGLGSAPEEVFAKDRVLLWSVGAWVAVFTMAIYA